jgi:predicted transcriptional regulator
MRSTPAARLEGMLFELRHQYALSSAEIAQGAGLSRQHVWRLETGQTRPSFETFTRLERLQTEVITKSARPKAGG